MFCFTIWPVARWRECLPALELIRPPTVMLHSDPATLDSAAPTVVKELRSALGYPVSVWLGVAGDVLYSQTKTSGDLARLRALRSRAHRAAVACGASALMLDPETAWKHATPGFDAHAAQEWVETARRETNGLPIYVTSFDCPGYHAAFPYAAFDTCDRWAPQLYAAPAKGEPDPHAPMGRNRLALHRRQWGAAVKGGALRDRPYTGYVQLHHVTTRETCCIADAFDSVCGWAGPARVDADGLLAARVLCELDRRGFSGPGRIGRFQASVGLESDGLVGPNTLRALGLK